MRNYETTIIVNGGKARADFDAVLAEVRGLYETEGAEWIELEKWEERKLAYEINGETSACYLIGYFKADPAIVEKIERRVQLNETVLRQLIIIRDGADYDKIRDQRAKQADTVSSEG